MVQGEEIYRYCITCHGDQGQDASPNFSPMIGSPVTTCSLDEHIDMVMNGRPNTTVAVFKDQLNDADIAAEITNERNALGNYLGDFVQPAENKAKYLEV